MFYNYLIIMIISLNWFFCSKIKDATPAILVVIAFFMFPANWRCFRFFKSSSKPLPTAATGPLLTWKYINAKTPW